MTISFSNSSITQFSAQVDSGNYGNSTITIYEYLKGALTGTVQQTINTTDANDGTASVINFSMPNGADKIVLFDLLGGEIVGTFNVVGGTSPSAVPVPNVGTGASGMMLAMMLALTYRASRARKKAASSPPSQETGMQRAEASRPPALGRGAIAAAPAIV